MEDAKAAADSRREVARSEAALRAWDTASVAGSGERRSPAAERAGRMGTGGSFLLKGESLSAGEIFKRTLESALTLAAFCATAVWADSSPASRIGVIAKTGTF